MADFEKGKSDSVTVHDHVVFANVNTILGRAIC